MKKQELRRREEHRCTLQIDLDLKKTQAERNKLGQFSTPPALASEMLIYAKSILGEQPIRFLDPSFGTGSFYSALVDKFLASNIEAAKGFEIDPVVVDATSNLWKNTQLDLVKSDFTRLVSPTKEKEKFNLVICNPPYVRHHHLDQAEKQRLQRLIKTVDGTNVSGLSGLYCYFMLLTHAWMQEDGIAGWLVPTEFMDVNYGAVLRRYLTEETTLLRIHRFEPSDVQFSDALVSSSIIWFQKRIPSRNRKVQYTFGGSLTNPRTSTSIPLRTLASASKWNIRLGQLKEIDVSCPTLSEFFDIKRGLATGDNKFFILNEQQAIDKKLPKQYLKPILPGARFLPVDEVEADDNGVPNIQKKLFLLDCDLHEDTVRCQYPELWAYLKEGIKKGVSSRYLCSHRKIWYKQENRPAAPFLCTYMARKNNQGRTFRFIFNRSIATAANTYILLYPKPFLRDLIEEEPSFIENLWEAVRQISQTSLLDQCRSYGGGLYKLEPKELSKVAALPIKVIVNQKTRSL